MEQYKSNVAAVMGFLKSEGFSASTISLHKRCYQELEEFLIATNHPYSCYTASQWIERNPSSWDYRKCTGYSHCIRQLEDVWHDGCISPDHLCFRKPPYDLLASGFKGLLDSFLSDYDYGADDRYRISCARFLLYLQGKGVSSIKNLGYELLLKFHEEVEAYLVSDAHPLAWDDVLRFLSGMEDARYGNTVLKSSKHILSLLYIFLDMHRTGINRTLIWHWFDKVKPLLGTGWKQHRRTICQFLIFLDTGMVTTESTGNPSESDSVEMLPNWEKKALSSYLALLKREGWQPSTISMQKSSNLRFCRYLDGIGIQSFRKVTPEILKKFNLQDEHGTAEGKAAYNCRIRSFILYLYEQGLVDAPYLYKALPTLAAPRTSIVKTLSKEAASIWAVEASTLSPKELRDYAIVCIGLSMGFRASDIISLRFADVDWKQRSIRIIQKKTGKALTMPMPVKTGNILFRYIRDGRPKSDSPYIFIWHEAPYDGVGRNVCRNTLSRFITPHDGKGCSFHIVRKTFATHLLSAASASNGFPIRSAILPMELFTNTFLWTRNVCVCARCHWQTQAFPTKEAPSMHKNYEYKSVFSGSITDYILSCRKAGFLFDNPAYWLYRFDQFCCSNKIQERSISKQLFETWASKNESETKTTQCNRLEALRNFSIYLNTVGIPSYIPANLPRPEKTVPYLMTDSDIREFFEQVDLYDTRTTKDSFKRMAQEYRVLFRLIYCCGLRNNEACSLKTANINLAEGSISIYQSKGSKDRIVYLSDDLCLLCSDYLHWLHNQLGLTSEWVFPGKDPKSHIPKTSVDRKFNDFWNATESSASCDKRPTVHCLRHAYVIKRMNLWMDGDVPLHVMMPYLSSFLGHKGPMETYYYYHQVEDTFRTIKRKDVVSSRVIPEVRHEE